MLLAKGSFCILHIVKQIVSTHKMILTKDYNKARLLYNAQKWKYVAKLIDRGKYNSSVYTCTVDKSFGA